MWDQAIQSLRVTEPQQGVRGQALIAYMEARAGQKARARAMSALHGDQLETAPATVLEPYVCLPRPSGHACMRSASI
jgi:hypothetical protein